MKGDFAKFGLAVGAAGVVIGVIATQMKKAVDITVTYADEVRTLSSVTNQSAETTSRMIQTLDDYGLSAQQAGSAARFLAKEGLSLNIETLAELSDEYKKLNTGQERAEFLMKNFGKAGQDFALIMEEGSDAIKKRNDTVKDGLVLSDKQLKAAQDLKYAQDDLNDIEQALYVTAGNKGIPVWTRYLKSLNDVLEGGNLFTKMAANFVWSINEIAGAGEGNITTLREMADAQTNYYKSLAGMPEIDDTIADATAAMLDFTDAVGAGRDTTARWLLIQYQANLAMRNIPAEEAARKMLDYEYALGLVSKAEYDAKLKALGLRDAIASLQSKDIFVTTYMITRMGQQGDPIQQAQAQFSSNAAQGLVIGGGGSGWVYKASGYGKGPDGKTRYYYNPSTGAYKAAGGPASANGLTLVGEMGPELIDKSGMVINAHNTKRMLGRGMIPGRRMATGGAKAIGDFGNNTTGYTYPKTGYNLADDWVMMGMPNAPQNWVTNYNNKIGGGGSSAVIQTAAAASTAASQAAQQTSRAVDVTAQMSQQAAISSAAQAASLASIDRRLANMPNQIRDAFQQVIQQ